MRKLLFVLLLAFVTISAIPVEQVPLKVEPAVVQTETKPAATTTTTTEQAKTEVKTETKTEVQPEAKTEVKTETKTEVQPEVKTETKTDASGPRNDAPSGPRNDAQPETKADVKGQALNQVMDFISQVAQPLSAEEKDALKDIISVGGEILMEAEKKMKELHTLPEVQTLLQGDAQTGMFGMKSDGSIDAEVAASQMTELLAKMAPENNPLTSDEKSALHDLISGFSKAFAPTKETTEGLQKDFEKILQSVAPAGKEGKHDELLGATNLISVFSDTEHGINTKLLSELTEKFLDSMEKQFKKMELTN